MDYKYFKKENTFNLNQETVIVIWSDSVSSEQMQLDTGKYNVTIISNGTAALELSLSSMYVDDTLINSFSNSTDFEKHKFILELNKSDPRLRFELANDFYTKDIGQDRNLFIRRIIFNKINN